MVSTICSGHPSARAAAAIFSMTCSLFFSLFFAVSMRQVDIASKAAFTALRASSESPGAHIGSPAPVRLEPRAMPADDRLWAENRNRAEDGREPTIEPNKQKAKLVAEILVLRQQLNVPSPAGIEATTA